MAFTAGVANVLVVPSFKGFQQAVGRQVSSAMPAAGRTAGAAMGGGMAAGLRGSSAGVTAAAGTAAAGATAATATAGRAAGVGFVGRAVAGLRAGQAALTGAAATAFGGAAAAGAAAGTATGSGFMGGLMRTMAPLAAILGPAAIIGGGWNRLANIEDAQAKLTGLGHSAETVTTVMDNALAAVQGTAFGLDEAATLAAGLLAAGIQPGEELTRILGLAADSATIAGTSLGEMGSIWSKIAAGGRIQGEEINQLGDRGIPILQLLAEEMGTTVEGVRELSREGAIGFGDFANAMETGMAGAALKSGETTRGTLRNVGAAISRLGAAILEDVFPKIREWGNLAIGVVDNQVIPAWERTVGWVRSNSEWLTPLAAGVGAMAAAMTAWSLATGAVGIAWRLMETMIGSTVIGRIVLIVGGLIVALLTAWQTSDTFRVFVTNAWESIRGVIDAVVGWITGTAVPWLAGAWESIKGGVSAVGDVFVGVWRDYIQPAWQAVAAGATWLWETILQPIFGFIATAWGYTGGWIFDVIQNVVLLAWDLMVFAIRAAWQGYIKPIFDNIGLLWSFIAVGIQAVWHNVLKPVWDAIAAAINVLWVVALRPVFDAIRARWEQVALAMQLIWLNVLKPVWDAVAGFVTDTIVPGVRLGLGLLEMAWRGVANMMREPINWVINFVWNDGLKAAFDGVAAAIGSDARLPAAPTIPAFAKGGLARPGWALVGEEGPELVNFTSPGRVYTAGETQRMLGQGGESNPPHGAGFWDDVGNAWSGTWRGAVDTVKTGASAAVDWARGGLANAANFVLSPLFNGLGGLMSHWGPTGQIGADTMTSVKDRLVEWIRGKDDEAPKGLSGPVGKAGDPGSRSIPGALGYVNRAGWALADEVGGIRMLQTLNKSMAGGHRTGKAIDFWDSLPKLNALADAVTRTGGFGNLNYMAWQGRLWSPDRGWRAQGRGFGNDPQHRRHLHAEWYDQGGMLMPGSGMYANGTGSPEPVLTSGQWRDISTLAAKGATGPEFLYIVDADRQLIGRMQVEADGRIKAAASRTDRVGRLGR